MKAMGDAYERAAAARPPRAAVPDAGLRGRATPRSGARARAASPSWCATVADAGGRHPGGDLGLLRPRDAAQRRRAMLESRLDECPGHSDLPPPAGRSCSGSLRARCWWRRCSRCRCSACSATSNDFDDPSRRGGRRARRRRSRPPARRGAAARRAGAAGRAGGLAQPAQARIARGRAARCAIRGVAAWCAYAPRRRPRGSSRRDGRSTYLLATFRDDEQRRARRDRGSGSRAPGRDARRRRDRRAQVGDQVRRTSRAPSCSRSRSSSCCRCSCSAASSRRCCRSRSAARRSCSSFLAIRGRQRADQPDVDLRAEPDQRARARAGDRLLAVHGLALPRGAGGAGATARRRCARRCAPRAGRAVLAPSRWRALAALLVFRAALPLLDGRRRRAVRADRGAACR